MSIAAHTHRAAATERPQSVPEAERRYWRRYGPALLELLLGERIEIPASVDAWIALAEATRDTLDQRAAALDALSLARADALSRIKP